ncbi:MAG TPA: histidine--tRNA ligase, partial [Phycisphaerae bacterium]|nr:histidine--tRNA ligase [Phycisphaerae bacterium]
YTGIVYEAFDSGSLVRAVAGGGRYDNLLQLVGGPKVPATGFAVSDVIIGILLEERDKIPGHLVEGMLDFFVVAETKEDFDTALQVVAALREKGIAADYSFKRQAIGKQLKEANRRGAKQAAIVRDGAVAVKDLATGDQAEPVTTDQFLKTAGG